MEIALKQKPAPGNLVLDHIGHFVSELDEAGKVLTGLGFSPTPVSNHLVSGKPGGTANRCVMFEEGYLEILAPTADTPNGRRVRHFMSRYQGVHLVCYGTPAAEAEHARLAAHGFTPDPLVDLGRKLADGSELRFKVVYVPPDKMPECRAQYCQHLTPQFLWTGQTINHENGALGLAAAYIVADDPAVTAARWAEFSGLLPLSSREEVILKTARGTVHIATRDALSKFIDNVPAAPSVAAIALRFKDPMAFAERCRKAGLKVRKTAQGHCVSLPAALGGSWIF